MQIKYFFMMNLSQRGYTGKLVVDHDKKHLKMQLNVDTSGTLCVCVCVVRCVCKVCVCVCMLQAVLPLVTYTPAVRCVCVWYCDKAEVNNFLTYSTAGASQEVHDVRTLSGGERSYSTVCFICSIWNIMESPFRYNCTAIQANLTTKSPFWVKRFFP